MKIDIRVAVIADATAFIEIKNQLPLTMEDGSATTGGFLLGTDIETYKKYIQEDYCLVAEQHDKIVGFGILLKDDSLRNSDIWIRRNQATWSIDISRYEERKICYFEQLAFLSGHSRTVLKLAYNLARRAFEDGHTYLFTTTVHKPVKNLAAVPYLLRASGRKVGNINEIYPGIGEINSDIYGLESSDFMNAVAVSNLKKLLENSYQIW